MGNEDNEGATGGSDKIEVPRALKKLAKDFALKDKTIEILMENDIDSILAIKSLSVEDVQELGFSMGQRNLMRNCVASLQEPSPRAEPSAEPPSSSGGYFGG